MKSFFKEIVFGFIETYCTESEKKTEINLLPNKQNDKIIQKESENEKQEKANRKKRNQRRKNKIIVLIILLLFAVLFIVIGIILLLRSLVYSDS